MFGNAGLCWAAVGEQMEVNKTAKRMERSSARALEKAQWLESGTAKER